LPVMTPSDQVGLHISTLKKNDLATYSTPQGRHPFPLAALITQVVSDRLVLAGEHLRTGDELVRNQHHRSAISRHYYAMYHAARAIVFAEVQGDDYERHIVLPRNLPSQMEDVTLRESELTDARLLRNKADYDIYPHGHIGWETDARTLAGTAAAFVSACEVFALANGFV
jgi:uncharacterized protein (UPF0332 family)